MIVRARQVNYLSARKKNNLENKQQTIVFSLSFISNIAELSWH